MIRWSLLFLSILGLSASALAVFRPGWATAVGLDLWNLPAWGRNLAAQRRHAALLDTRDEIVRGRIAAKAQIVRAVVSRRLTLLEAAARFRTIDVEHPDFPGPSPDSYAGRTENERYCRLVLNWVQAEVNELAPSRAVEILQRLSDELESHLASHGGEVILPRIPSEHTGGALKRQAHPWTPVVRNASTPSRRRPGRALQQAGHANEG